MTVPLKLFFTIGNTNVNIIFTAERAAVQLVSSFYYFSHLR